MFRRLLVGVAVLLSAGAVAVDRIAASVAGDRVADRVQGSESLTTPPKVTFGGFPFLTQALRGRYAEVSVTATEVRRGPVLVASIHARLHGVRLPLADALRGSTAAVPVDSVDATALFRYRDLSAALPDNRLTLSEDNGRIRVRGAVAVFGQRVSGSALGEIRVEGNRLTVVPHDFTFDGGGRTVAFNRALAAALTYSVPINLPFGLKLQSVQPAAEGLLVRASGQSVVLRR